MKKGFWLLCLCFAVVSRVLAAEAITETFEEFSTGAINGQNGWAGSGSHADIVTSVVHGGEKSLYLNGFFSYATLNTGFSALDHDKNSVSFWYREASGFGTNDTGDNGSMRVPIVVTDGYNQVLVVLNVCHAGSGHRSILLTNNYIGNGQCVNGIGDMTEGTWYHIEIAFDFGSASAYARLDSGAWGPAVSMAVYGGETGNYIVSVGMYSIWDNPPEFWFDDFRVVSNPDPQLEIVVDPSDGGTVSSSPSGLSCSGGTCQGNFSGSVSLTATPDDGCIFAYWNDGTITSGDNPLTVNMSGDKTLSAVFICSLQWPLTGSIESRTISLGFGDDWLTSCDGQIKRHAGIDIPATASETVYAAESGTVKVAQTDQQWGGWVTLEHDGYTTVYWHITPSVSVNDSVVKGDSIGAVVNYGGPVHLHFGLRKRPFSQDNVPNAGALPQAICGGYPAFPEYFVDPETLSY